jgi:parallel beta-helix repeat protein
VIIDGLSQPGSASMAPMVNIDGRFLKGQLGIPSPLPGGPQPGTNIGLAPGLEVVASDVTIRGLGINRFPGPGVYVNNGTNNVRVEDSAIGAGLAGVMTWPANNVGVWLNRSTNHVIARNVISSSETSGILIVGGSGTSITGNRIGTSADGLTALPNIVNGITLYDGATATIIDGNLISGNGTIGQPDGHGIDIQHNGALAEVTNTVITNNVIGLDAAGNVLARAVGDYIGPGPGFVNVGPVQRGNSGGGIRVQRSAGTQIGLPGNGNTISGNTTEGVRIEGAHSVAPVLRANRIGLDPTGTSARGNTSRGVEVDGSAAVIGQAGAGNGNVISGNISDGVVANGNTVIENNLIGTTAAGTVALGNASLVDGGTPFSPGCCHSGVFVIAPNNTVRANVIAGHNANQQDSGVRSQGASGQAPNLIEDNWIGTDQTGTLALGNGVGIGMYGDQSGTTIRRNVIAFNDYLGIWLTGGVEGAMIGGVLAADGNEIRNNLSGVVVGYDLVASEVGNSILSNRITNHLWRGILLGGNHPAGNDVADGDGGPNGQQNFPVLSNVSNAGLVTTFDYTLDSLQSSAVHTIQVFANTACHVEGHGEGARLVGSFLQISDFAGDMAVVGAALTELVPVGQFLTATATDGNGNTSEFSQCVQVPALPPGGVITSMTPSGQVAAGFGQLVHIRGTGMLGLGTNDVLFSNGGPEFPAQYTWSAGPNLVVARLPTGVLTPGLATVRVRNPGQTLTTAAFPFVLSNTPGAPVVNTVQSGCGTGAAINATTVGATISFHSEGVDTNAFDTTITWTGPGGTFNHVGSSVGGGISGSVMVCATVPVLPAGVYTVSLRTTVNGNTSAASNSFVISVS